jgi:hypothetical protein
MIINSHIMFIIYNVHFDSSQIVSDVLMSPVTRDQCIPTIRLPARDHNVQLQPQPRRDSRWGVYVHKGPRTSRPGAGSDIVAHKLIQRVPTRCLMVLVSSIERRKFIIMYPVVLDQTATLYLPLDSLVHPHRHSSTHQARLRLRLRLLGPSHLVPLKVGGVAASATRAVACAKTAQETVEDAGRLEHVKLPCLRVHMQ